MQGGAGGGHGRFEILSFEDGKQPPGTLGAWAVSSADQPWLVTCPCCHRRLRWRAEGACALGLARQSPNPGQTSSRQAAANTFMRDMLQGTSYNRSTRTDKMRGADAIRTIGACFPAVGVGHKDLPCIQLLHLDLHVSPPIPASVLGRTASRPSPASQLKKHHV
jgi:hypothetical protein